jgi:hypothetical protein
LNYAAGALDFFQQLEFFDFVLEIRFDLHAHEDFEVFIAEVFIEFLEAEKVEIPHQEKEVLRRGKDIINDFVEEPGLVGD